MNSFTFITSNPFDTLLRVMDCARKTNFTLLDLSVSLRGQGVYVVRLSFGAAGAISFSTLCELCRRIVDVAELSQIGTDPPASRAAPAGGGTSLPH